MGKFWRENWLWIVTPVVLILLALAAVIVLGGDDPNARFDYNIF